MSSGRGYGISNQRLVKDESSPSCVSMNLFRQEIMPLLLVKGTPVTSFTYAGHDAFGRCKKSVGQKDCHQRLVRVAMSMEST